MQEGHLRNDTYMTYKSTQKDGTLGPASEVFARQLSMFNLMWRRSIQMHMGFNQDVNPARIFAIYRDPENHCDSVVMTFPGQQVTFKESSYNDTANPNCLDLRAEYPNMWLHSIVLNEGKKTIFNEYNDPFGYFKNIIAVTQEVTATP